MGELTYVATVKDKEDFELWKKWAISVFQEKERQDKGLRKGMFYLVFFTYNPSVIFSPGKTSAARSSQEYPDSSCYPNTPR